MFGRKVSTIALDNGPGTLALCQLARARNGVTVQRWGVLEDPLRERPTGLSDAQLGERLGRLVRQGGFNGRRATIALKPPEVTLIPAQVPAALLENARSQILATLRLEAGRQAKSDPETLEIDYWTLPPGNRAGSNVMIAAVKRETVLRWNALFESIGLELARVDVEPWALTRSAFYTGIPGGAGRPLRECLWGILDIGFSSTVLTIALANQCVYVRHSPGGGDAWTSAIAEAMQIDYRSAELLKRQRVDGGVEGEAGDPLGGAAHEVRGVLRARIRSLAGEIERAFSYALESYPEATATGLYLCGGGARLEGLPEALHGLLGVDVLRLDPGARLSCAPRAQTIPDSQRPNVATCVGLALGDVE